MNFLYMLESIRCPFLNAVMSVITQLGSEALFMAAALVIFWCVDKQRGYYVLTVGFAGTILNQFLKLMFRVPRPWVRDPDFTIVESARADAGGYSFPSGHTQNVTSYLGCIARTVKKAVWRVVLIILILLTAFSRMYLGVHTPADVVTALVTGAVLVLALYPVFQKGWSRPGFMYAAFSVMLILSAAYTGFTELHQWPVDIDPENLAEGIKNGWSLTGACAGMFLSYHIDRKYINFKTEAPLPAQIFKSVFGLAVAVIVKTVLKAPFSYIFHGSGAAHGLRYFIMAVFAACLWPMLFPAISAIFRKKQ